MISSDWSGLEEVVAVRRIGWWGLLEENKKVAEKAINEPRQRDSHHHPSTYIRINMANLWYILGL